MSNYISQYTGPQIDTAVAKTLTDVVGPISSITGNVAVFDSNTGKIIKDGGTLGTAAFTATGAYDPAGAAATVSGALSTHAGLTTGVHGLGTAAQQNVSYFATASQGSLADSALQSSDIGTTIQAYNVNTTTQGTITLSSLGAAAEADLLSTSFGLTTHESLTTAHGLQIANNSSIGLVKPDGTTITIDVDGTIHSIGGSTGTGGPTGTINDFSTYFLLMGA